MSLYIYFSHTYKWKNMNSPGPLLVPISHIHALYFISPTRPQNHITPSPRSLNLYSASRGTRDWINQVHVHRPRTSIYMPMCPWTTSASKWLTQSWKQVACVSFARQEMDASHRLHLCLVTQPWSILKETFVWFIMAGLSVGLWLALALKTPGNDQRIPLDGSVASLWI